MSNIKCIILDDEPIAREVIENFVKRISFLQLVAVAEDAFEAIKILEDNRVDLLISDIRMPGINGLQLVRSLLSPPLVIFITAYKSFAVSSFELDVVDYLLKPVSFERFLKAISKARLQIGNTDKALNQKNESAAFIFVRIGEKGNNKDDLVKIENKDILYIKTEKDHLIIRTSGANIQTYSTLKAIQKKLPSNYFIRIHNSHLVSMNAIQSVKANTVLLANNEILLISKRHKAELLYALSIPR